MRYVTLARIRFGRLLAVLIALSFYLLFITVDALHFLHTLSTASLYWLLWVRFGVSALFALMFLAIGLLVWLYARNRRVALLLFCFSLTMMVTFAELPEMQDPLLSTVGTVSTVLTIAFFALLLLSFPHNYLIQLKREAGGRHLLPVLLRCYVVLLCCWPLVIVAFAVVYWQAASFPPLVELVTYSFCAYALGGSLVTIIVSYFRAPSLQERQQRRLLVSGSVLALAPVLFLTILPRLLLPPQYVIDGQFSGLWAGLLPLALGYTILRYQMLVLDVYVRRIVAWIVGGVGLALFGYVDVAFLRVLFSGLLSSVWVAVVMAVGGPLIWRLSHYASERFFSPEMKHYHDLILEAQAQHGLPTEDLASVSHVLVRATAAVFGGAEVALFVLDEENGAYRCSAHFQGDSLVDSPDDCSGQWLFQMIEDVLPVLKDDGGLWLEISSFVLERLKRTKRPLLFGELRRTADEHRRHTWKPSVDLRRFTSGEHGPLLAPIWARGPALLSTSFPLATKNLVGVLILGERTDLQLYGGPDFDAIHFLLSRFSQVLEAPRRSEEIQRRIATVERFYQASAFSLSAGELLEKTVHRYAEITAQTLLVGVEVWLSETATGWIQRIHHLGTEPSPFRCDRFRLEESDWTASFYHGKDGSSSRLPIHLQQAANFAWLPLTVGERRVGILVLAYPHFHRFSQEEQLFLETFADYFVEGLSKAETLGSLTLASQQQQEQAATLERQITATVGILSPLLHSLQEMLSFLAFRDTSVHAGARPALPVAPAFLSKAAVSDALLRTYQNLFLAIAAQLEECVRSLNSYARMATPVPVAGLKVSSFHERSFALDAQGDRFGQKKERREIWMVVRPEMVELLSDGVVAAGCSPLVYTSGQALLSSIEQDTWSEHALPAAILLEEVSMGMDLSAFRYRLAEQMEKSIALILIPATDSSSFSAVPALTLVVSRHIGQVLEAIRVSAKDALL